MTARPSRRHTSGDGTKQPTNSGNVHRDGCDTSPRGRHTGLLPSAKGPHPREQPTTSSESTGQTTATLRSADHAQTTTNRDGRPAHQGDSNEPASTAAGDEPANDRAPLAGQGTSVPSAETTRGQARRPRRGHRAGRLPAEADASLVGAIPTPRRTSHSPTLTHDEAMWIDSFLTMLENKGFFDETKARDIRTILG